jgi:LacI family transcriptional regulator
MNITIREIAADLQLSISTVSKALGDSHEISAETKKRVFEYAERVNYAPNVNASGLKKRKTKNIAVIIPEIADSFFAIVINGIESIAQEKGYHVIIYLTHEDQKKEQAIIRDFSSGRVDGVLLSLSNGNGPHDYIRDLNQKELPMVLFDRVFEKIDSPKIRTDDFDSGYKAAVHLIQKGCREIAFLSLSENLSIISYRLDGYKKALRDHNIEINDANIVECSNQELTSSNSIRKLLTKENRPDGIICSVEKLTTLAYTICHELNLSIPKDVKVISFSSISTAAILNPSLTTITQPAFEMGKAAATALFELLADNKSEVENKTIVIPSTLIERASTQ